MFAPAWPYFAEKSPFARLKATIVGGMGHMTRKALWPAAEPDYSRMSLMARIRDHDGLHSAHRCVERLCQASGSPQWKDLAMPLVTPTPARDTPQEHLAGSVERVPFHSEETGFCVLRVKV